MTFLNKKKARLFLRSYLFLQSRSEVVFTVYKGNHTQCKSYQKVLIRSNQWLFLKCSVLPVWMKHLRVLISH